MSGELQKDDSDDDEGDAGNAYEGRGFSENDDPDERGAHRSDPGPDRIGRPERKRFHPLREDDEAQNHEEDRRDGRKKFREALARLERKRPDDFENAGDENVCPGHDVCLPAGPSPLMYERLCGSSRTAASERFSLRDSEAPEW